MKRLALIIIVALVPLPLCAQRHHATPTPTPSPDPKGVIVKQGMVCRTKQKDLELRDWIGGLMRQVHDAQFENDAAQKTNADTITTLGMSVKDAAALIRECASDKACSNAPLSCWFHRLMKHLFWILGGIVVLAIGLLVASIFVPALGPILSLFVSLWKRIIGLFVRKPPPV